MRYSTTKTWNRRLRLVGIVLLFAAEQTVGSSLASAQNPSTPSSGQSELVEGLLDLLKEPASDTAPMPNNDRPLKNPDLKPSDIGLDGEDLGEQSDDPLAAVRQSMMIAAAYLERGVTNQQTQALQNDIVLRLEELIQQLQSPDAQPPSDPQNKQEQQATSSQQQISDQQVTDQQSTAMQNRSEPGAAEMPTGPSGSQPGQKGPQASAEVQLTDPRALQESVWGQLPEQVRKQMQSRMVERFLPSYRRQIEAYFQTLMKEQ